MNSEPRIAPLHVGKVVPPPYAGIEAHIDTLLRSFGGAVDATLVATEGAAGVDAPYRILAAKRWGSLASLPLSPAILSLVRREIASRRANLLHLHAPNPWGDLAALAAPRSLPVVMSWHSDIVRQKRLMQVYRPLQRRAIDRADRIVLFTPKHLESSEQLKVPGLAAKIASIPMGIDFARLDNCEPDQALLADIDQWSAGRPLALTVGRHIYYKGYEYLIRALAATRSQVVLVMVGTGPLTPTLEALADALGVASRIRFLGQLGNRGLVSLFHRCDVFTLPSIEPSEAFGIASAEAMAVGKPTVVCELDNGVNYLNRAGITSLVTPPRDVAALADAIDQLANDSALRAAMGAAGRAWVRSEFSVERMRDETLALYRSML